jgi:hypothetical protein
LRLIATRSTVESCSKASGIVRTGLLGIYSIEVMNSYLYNEHLEFWLDFWYDIEQKDHEDDSI